VGTAIMAPELVTVYMWQSWEEAKALVKKLNEISGPGVRLYE